MNDRSIDPRSASEDVFEVLRDAYYGGTEAALLDAFRYALHLASAPAWVREELQSALQKWNNGETQEFAEPWGLVRPKHWRQKKQLSETKPVPEHDYLSLKAAVLRRIANLIEGGEKRSATVYGGVFVLVSGEFASEGISAAKAMDWWHSDPNPFRRDNL